MFLFWCPIGYWDDMNLLLLLCLYQLSHAGNGRFHGPSVEVIWDMDQLGILNLSVIRNGRILEPFQLRAICDKCWKKVVKGAGIFCGNFYLRRGQYPPFQRVWYGGCYVEHPKYDLPKSGKEYVGHQEVELEGRY